SDEKPQESENIAVINLGHTYTNIIVARGDSPYFTRDIQIGGAFVAQSIASQLGIDPDTVFDKPFDTQAKGSEMKESAKRILSKLGDEIRLSLGYYENQYGGSINRLYLAGGLASCDSVCEYFEETIGIKPVVWNPLNGFHLAEGLDRDSMEGALPSLAVACGLILRQDN
ncbi:MAG: pilus assembly protein PilM, partial [Candidatus Omnitrophota bacterium]